LLAARHKVGTLDDDIETQRRIVVVSRMYPLDSDRALAYIDGRQARRHYEQLTRFQHFTGGGDLVAMKPQAASRGPTRQLGLKESAESGQNCFT
jgi:hypothetical protein